MNFLPSHSSSLSLLNRFPLTKNLSSHLWAKKGILFTTARQPIICLGTVQSPPPWGWHPSPSMAVASLVPGFPQKRCARYAHTEYHRVTPHGLGTSCSTEHSAGDSRLSAGCTYSASQLSYPAPVPASCKPAVRSKQGKPTMMLQVKIC